MSTVGILHADYLRVLSIISPPSHTRSTDDENNSEHRSDQELQCTLNYVELGREVQVPHCSESELYGLQFGHVDANTNHSFVIAEMCFVNETDNVLYGRSRLTRLSHVNTVDVHQLPVKEVSVREYPSDDIGHNEIGDLSAVQELRDALFVKIDKDPLWTTASTVRSYDAWERYMWNAHRLGLEYLHIDARKMSAPLTAVVENLTARVAGRTQSGPVELYTGYIGELEAPEVAGGKITKVPKYVWFVALQLADVRKAVAYIVPNGGHEVERDMCENQCNDEVFCCKLHDFAKNVKYLQSVFGPISELL